MKYHINLFPKKEKNIVDKSVYFALHYLRYILVITQLIVIIVFFYSFKVNQEKIDLKEGLSQKEEIIKISEPIVKEAQIIQQKVQNVQATVQNQKQFAEIFEYLLSVFPEKLNLNRLEISKEEGFELTGKTSDPTIVKIFYDRLNKDKKFAEIELKNVKKELVGFSFTLGLRIIKTSKKT